MATTFGVVCGATVMWKRKDFRPEDLKPEDLALNRGKESGTLNHTVHKLDLHFPPGTSMAAVEEEVYASLKHFDQFDGDANWLAVSRSWEKDGIQYIFFDTQGFFGILSDVMNPKLVPVRAWSDSVDRIVVADTAGRHMLVGQRRWQCQQRSKLMFRIVTESYDHPRGFLNKVGMMVGAWLQMEVWKGYFLNIKAHHENRTDGGPQASYTSLDNGVHTLLYDQSNPWQPRNPYPGIEVSTGGNALIG
jgi:hypothetical protein